MPGRTTAEVLNILTKIVLHTGKGLGQVTAEDLFEYRTWHLPLGDGRAGVGVHAPWQVSQSWTSSATTYRSGRPCAVGQRPTAELVDAYGIESRPIRDVLVRYFDERRPSLDYGSSRRACPTYLVGNFWADIERHHPGIDTLHLPDEVAAAWKERMRYVTLKDGTKRAAAGATGRCSRVSGPCTWTSRNGRIEDPSWAQWAVPSPVRRGETQGMIKQKKADRARMHQRTRERLPHLPVLADAADRHRRDRAELLDKAAHTDVGEPLEHDGRRLPAGHLTSRPRPAATRQARRP